MTTRTAPPELSLGELVAQVSADLSTLARKEVELAKAELSAELAKAGKGAGLLGGAGFLGHLALVFGALGAMFGLSHWMPIGCAAATIALLFAVLAAVMALLGRRTLGSLDPAPHRTIATLKEDAAWARHPTS